MARLTGLTRRLIAATGVLLLLLSSSADALGLHRCAHHDALPSAAQAETGHHDHHSAPADTDEPEHETCTCVGTCSVSTAVAAPLGSSVVLAPALHGAIGQSPPPAVPQAQPAAHLLPYSTAPPAL